MTFSPPSVADTQEDNVQTRLPADIHESPTNVMDFESADHIMDDVFHADTTIDDSFEHDDDFDMFRDTPQSIPSSRSVSPGMIVLADARFRNTTPVSPEYEDLISDESETDAEPLSPFEGLPSEVSWLSIVRLSG